MKYNLNIYEVMLRYALMTALIIIGGLILQPWMLVLAMLVFLTAILGWCPLYQALGIDRAGQQDH